MDEVLDIIDWVSEAIGVDLDYRTADATSTVGEFYELVLQHVPLSERSGCVTQAAFYRGRTALAEEFDLPRDAVTLDLPLDHIIPRAGRRAAWSRLRQSLELWMYDLGRPRAVKATAALVPLAAIAAAANGHAWGAFLGIVPALLIWLVITEPAAVVFPVPDVRGLSLAVARHNTGELGVRVGLGSDDVWQAIVGIVAWYADVPPERVTYDTQWWRDLKMG